MKPGLLRLEKASIALEYYNTVGNSTTWPSELCVAPAITAREILLATDESQQAVARLKFRQPLNAACCLRDASMEGAGSARTGDKSQTNKLADSLAQCAVQA